MISNWNIKTIDLENVHIEQTTNLTGDKDGVLYSQKLYCLFLGNIFVHEYVDLNQCMKDAEEINIEVNRLIQKYQ